MGDAGPIVYLVDDDPAVLRALDRVLSAAGFCTAPFDSPQRFLECHEPLRPGCAVLDLAMPGMDGIELQKLLEPQGADLPPRLVIFLSGKGSVQTSVNAMRRGAIDFLVKPIEAMVLVGAVRAAIERDAAARRAHAERAEIRSRIGTLTPREREVMALVVAGKLNKQAAAALGTTEKTIKVHRARVMQKMMADSLADLVRLSDRGRDTGE